MRKLTFAMLSALATLGPAHAQQLTGTANQSFCHVVIVTCEEGSEDSCRPEFDGRMTNGQSFTSRTGRLCYKRDKTAGDCRSGLSPYWSCASAAGNPTLLIQ